MEITIKLTLDEVNGMLNLFGKLPTETNVWPLAAKIRAQAEEQLPKESTEQTDGGSGQAAD